MANSAPSTSNTQINNSHSTLQKIKKLRKEGELDKAIILGQQHLKIAPKDVDVMLVLGLIYYDQKHFKAAKYYLNKVLSITPNYLQARLTLIKIALDEKQYDKASQLVCEAEKKSPSNKNIEAFKAKLKVIEDQNAPVLVRIKTLRNEGQLDEAIQLGREHLKEAPHDVDVMLLIGLMYYDQKKYQDAEHFLNNILLISPKYQDAQKALVKVSIAKKQFHKALLIINGKKSNIKRSNIKKIVLPKKKKMAITLEDIKAAKGKKEINKALALGRQYLKHYPNDVDVLLLMGTMLAQKKEYVQAAHCLEKVLQKTPNYTDARVALIKVRIAQNKYQQASDLIKTLRRRTPHDPNVGALEKQLALAKEEAQLVELGKAYTDNLYDKAIKLAKLMLVKNPYDLRARSILADSYFMTKRYDEAKNEYLILLELKPNSKKILKGLIALELAMGDTREAQVLVRDTLKVYPRDPEFLAQQSEVDYYLHKYAKAADVARKVLQADPSNKTAKYLIKDIGKFSPHLLYGTNAAGGYSDIVYVSDLQASWQYSHMYYNENTSWGLLSTSINNASRFGFNDNQGVLNLIPILNKYFFVDIIGAYANQPRLFPTLVVGGEAYYSRLPIVVSAGRYHSSIIPLIAFDKITGSLSTEIGKYWVSFRPNYYKPRRGPESLLYTGTVVRYFNDQDTNIRVNFGTGTSPDLADFLTVDFIVVRMKIISLNLQVPLFNHRLLFTMGGNYQHWIFPNLKIREISGGLVGLNYRFRGLNG